MAEARTSVKELFANDQFGMRFAEWRRTTMALDERLGQLRDHITKKYGHHSNMTRSDVDQGVSYSLGASPERFRDLNYGDEKAFALRGVREAARAKEHLAKTAMLGLSVELGISQFADYGLWLHTKDASVITAADLQEKTEAAENHFLEVDQLVRDHPGEVLTIVDQGASAARLDDGGIDIVNRSYVAFPVKGYGTCFHTPLSSRRHDIYQSSELSARPCDIHGNSGSKRSKILQNWADAKALNDWYIGSQGAAFIIGDPIEGEPVIPEGRENEGLEVVFDRIRTVGNEVVRITALQNAQ